MIAVRTIAAGWPGFVAVALLVASAHAEDQPSSGPPAAPASPPPAEPAVPPPGDGPAVGAEPAAPAPVPPQAGQEASPPPPPRAADGTTSVMVPSPDPAAVPPPPASSPPPAPPAPTVSAPAPAAPAPTSPPAPAPPATLQPPPQSEAAALLARLLEPLPGPPPDATLYARPMSLLEPLARSGDRSRRLWIVQAYWKVSASYATVKTMTESLQRLELVAPGGDPHDRATLDVATAAARADLADARARLVAAQQELVDLALLPFGEQLPWPIDRPLADAYQTHFEVIFAARIATGRVRAIVRGLPARHEALVARAAAVVAAEKAMAMAEGDHAKGRRPIEAVVAAHAATVAQQQAFIETARVYNLEIAEYAMAVGDLSLPDDQFVAMLIGTPIQWRPQPVEPAGGTAAPPAATGPATTPPPDFIPAPTGIPAE